jgi:neutral ceramidase
MRSRNSLGLFFILVTLFSMAANARSADSGKFRVGAARIDVTPPLQELPKPYLDVWEHIYARTIVVDNGKTRAVLATVDTATISGEFPEQLTQKIAKEAGIPAEQVYLATTHAHDSIRVSNSPGTTNIPFSPAFNAAVEAALLQGVRQSIKDLQPARIGFGRGKAYINTNRTQWDPAQGRYITGADRSGLLPSDKTVYVIKFETLTGEPIAFFANYGIMPIVHGLGNYAGGTPKLGGDVPGATSRYIEKALNEKPVAIMTMGGGDQHPIYRIAGHGPAEEAASEVLTRTYGLMLGEEIMATVKDTKIAMEEGPIYGARKSATCPGKLTTPINSASRCSNQPGSKLPPCGVYKDEDAPPATFNIGLLLLGNIAIGGISEDVGTTIIQRVQAISPYANTFVVSQFFGPARYLVSDDTYGLFTFDSTDSHVKKGCAEQSILQGFRELLPK